MTGSTTMGLGACVMHRTPPSGMAVLEAKIAELSAAVEARDEFIAVAAHELRNPLTPIALQVELLLAHARRTANAGTLVTGLESLDLAVEKFLKRAEILLDVARIASGNFRPVLDEVDLSTLVEQGVTTMVAAAKHGGCPLRGAVQAGVWGRWDRQAVEQILENLISNAIKYGDGTPVTVSLTAEAAAARLSVRDEGPGISLSDQGRIFGRFEQAVTERNNYGGFGVGLWVSQQLATAMRGGITVSSEPRKGSTFTVALPF
jgi:two-component system, OmpR family, sensor kinase